MTHAFSCRCRTCSLRSEYGAIKMAWCWAMHWRLDWRKLASEHHELVEAIGPDAEGGAA